MRKLFVFLWVGLATIAISAENSIPKHGPLVAGSGDPIIAGLVAELLENSHYLGQKQPFDDKVSSRFLDRYINTLDPQHLHFLQSDLADFESFRTRLDNRIKENRDTSAAYAIANVFIDRIEQRMAYCQELLKNEKFDFNTSDRVIIDRKEEPFPKDLEEARRIWRDRLRVEVLQEVISQIKPVQTASIEGTSPPRIGGQPRKVPPLSGGLLDSPLPPNGVGVAWTGKVGADNVPTVFVEAPASLASAIATLPAAGSTVTIPDRPRTDKGTTFTFRAFYTNFVFKPEMLAAAGIATNADSPFLDIATLSFDQSNRVANLLASTRSNWVVQAAGESGSSVDKTNKVETPVEIVSRRYNRVLRIYREWDNEDVLEVFLTSLARVYDPHSDYMGKSAVDNFAISMSLSLFGIGARLTSEDGYCTIVELTDGGPAKRSEKLKPKDRIVAVAQGEADPVDVVDMKLNKVVEMIRGAKGTEVRLTVIPVDATDNSTRKVISLVREEIKLEDQEAKAKLMELPGEDGKPVRLGVIDLPSFYFNLPLAGSPSKTPPKSTTADVKKLLSKLTDEKVQGVVLDLRRNGGGSLEEAVKLTGLFIKQGPVVQVRDPDDTVTQDADDDDSVAYDGPLIVLTSHFSASASEILAGALQDYGRAVIVGDTSTHGKGTVQAFHQLALVLRQLRPSLAARLTSNPGALKFTIRKFYRASGASTQLRGVTPDLILPSVFDAIDVGEESLEDPLPWDEIKPAEFTPINTATPFLAELKKRSAARIAAEKDFAYIHEDYELAKKNRADKSVSLNLAEREKERRDAEARKAARDAERQARVKPPETDYELTLKLSDEPGLPPPIGKTNDLKVVSVPAGAATGTNTAAVTASSPHQAIATAEASDVDERIDVPLEEAKRVLLDYLSLLAAKRDTVVQAPQP